MIANDRLKTILVTGSAGFIGQELVAKMKQAGHRTIGVDIEPDGLSDICIRWDLRQSIRELPPFDVCVHLASAVGGILFNQLDGILEDNRRINENVIEICRRVGCEHFVFFSSINVFESNQTFAQGALSSEDQTTPYALSKAEGERIVAKAFPNCLVVRPTNVFGKSQGRRHDRVGESHVIPDLLKKIDDGGVVTVLGDGSQIRNFVHVGDICDFIVHNLWLEDHHYFNLRSDITVSIRELVRELMNFRSRDLVVEFAPEYMRYEAFQIRNFDVALPIRFGWHPVVKSIVQGLAT